MSITHRAETDNGVYTITREIGGWWLHTAR
jgi:hypothetical protein